jgi:hypothetical protein
MLSQQQSSFRGRRPELGFILQHEAAYGFQIQFRCQGYQPRALDYRVSSDGSILESGTAGGINCRVGRGAH